MHTEAKGSSPTRGSRKTLVHPTLGSRSIDGGFMCGLLGTGLRDGPRIGTDIHVSTRFGNPTRRSENSSFAFQAALETGQIVRESEL